MKESLRGCFIIPACAMGEHVDKGRALQFDDGLSHRVQAENLLWVIQRALVQSEFVWFSQHPVMTKDQYGDTSIVTYIYVVWSGGATVNVYSFGWDCLTCWTNDELREMSMKDAVKEILDSVDEKYPYCAECHMRFDTAYFSCEHM